MAKAIKAGQRRLAEVVRLDESGRSALFQACVELAKRESGPVESQHWPTEVMVLKPERIWVRDDEVLVELNPKGLELAAVMLSRNGEGDTWRLYLVNFDGARVFWPDDERVR